TLPLRSILWNLVGDLHILKFEIPSFHKPEITGNEIVINLYVGEAWIVAANIIPDKIGIVVVSPSVPVVSIGHRNIVPSPSTSQYKYFQLPIPYTQMNSINNSWGSSTDHRTIVLIDYAVVIKISVFQITCL